MYLKNNLPNTPRITWKKSRDTIPYLRHHNSCLQPTERSSLFVDRDDRETHTNSNRYRVAPVCINPTIVLKKKLRIELNVGTVMYTKILVYRYLYIYIYIVQGRMDYVKSTSWRLSCSCAYYTVYCIRVSKL